MAAARRVLLVLVVFGSGIGKWTGFASLGFFSGIEMAFVFWDPAAAKKNGGV
jgi:hypothetical protein